MSTVLPPPAQRRYPAADWEAFRPPGRRPGRPWRLVRHPLTVICAVQTALSLTLVWSNTAFSDEADYLRLGHLEIAHWLHGTSWPSAYADRVPPGSPIIYPPLGALTDSAGGLASARILSLAFMLGTTVLLYLTSSRLLGRTGAVVAAALWALSEPALRLTFATFDPLSVFLTALSAWLIVQAGYRRRSGAIVVAAAAALALANATAYPGIVIDPIVIAFAFLVWLSRMRARSAVLRTACFAGCSALFFGLLIAASRSWAGVMSTVIHQSATGHQSTEFVLKSIWAYSGLIIVLAVIGAFTAVSTERRPRAALLALLGCAAFIVPAVQLHERTAWSLDKHLAYGIWFAAIAAGYAASQLIRWLPGTSRRLTVICCVIALAYPAANSWRTAWQVYHSWPDAHSFITKFAPAVAQSRGRIYVASQWRVAAYYVPQGRQWKRWTTALSLDPVTVREGQREAYYTSQLNHGGYGLIVLFYPTTFSSGPTLPAQYLISPPGSGLNRELLRLVGGSGQPGLLPLTLAIEKNPEYKLVHVGQYNSAHVYSAYAIWRRVQN
jgi:Dolichyl-phosphate-mannose-protein mannosyltransferase